MMKSQLSAHSALRGNSPGYSLIEMLLCILIVTISAKGAVLCAQSVRETYRLKSTLHSALALCDFAAYCARRTNQVVELSINVEHTKLRVSAVLSPETLRDLTIPRSIYLQEFAVGTVGSDGSFHFYPDGNASPGRMNFVTDSGRRCIIFQALRGARRWQCHIA